MSRDQLRRVVEHAIISRGCGSSAPPWYDSLTRREFLAFSGAGLAVVLSSCGGSKDAVAPKQPSGRIAGEIVDLLGTPQPSLGTIYLMYENGLQTGLSVPVSSSGQFEFDDVAVGNWQLRFHAPGIAYVPEEYPHPVRVSVADGQTATVRIVTERGWEDGAPMIEIYAGDYFFQAQPLGSPNSETVVTMGTPICWYNVGMVQHTATGGPWDSGTMNRTDSYIWVPDRLGVFPYTCRFHGTQMIASLRIT